ncbi:hypothetical protein GGF32_008775 [Allomyces javanicus]|nr:hypothetical protein GGF32_008775 [Allomyces javanicus]
MPPLPVDSLSGVSDPTRDSRLSVPYEKKVDKTASASSSWPVSRPQDAPAPALASMRRGSGMVPHAPPLPPQDPSQWNHGVPSWASGSSRGPMSDTASEYSTMSSVRYSSGSGRASTPSVSSSKRWTPPFKVEESHGHDAIVPWPEEIQIANRLAEEKTGTALPMRAGDDGYYVAAGVLGFLTGTYSSLRSANNTISRHVRDYGFNNEGNPHDGIRKFSERWYITIDAFKTHIAPHIRGYNDIWAKKG